jgi:F-type H+-transporting ATPase subunit delta
MIQASDRLLATRYGKALFLAAVEKNEEDRVLRELIEGQRLAGDAAMSAFLKNPRVSGADKKKKLGEGYGGKASALTIRFIGLLIDKKRFFLLPLLAAGLTRLIEEKKNMARAAVRTARPLPPGEAELLRARLGKFSGKTVELDVKEDPELIGGAVVRIGDWVLDGSLRGQLQRMKEALSNGN